MPVNPLDDLIDDIKTRPIPYAAVAALGVAAAVVLASRALQEDSSGVRKATDRASEAVSDVASKAGISQSTVAVLIGTLLSKGVTGWMKRRDAQQARSQGAALSEASGRDLDARLHDMTVAELREIATERDIAGRSTMNKDELVDALATG